MKPSHTNSDPSNALPADARAWLTRLRDPSTAEDRNQTLAIVASDLCDAIERIIDEQSDMADELLCVYEQLGIVFEIARKLSNASRETDVIQLFLDNLRISFPTCEVFFVRRSRESSWTPFGTKLPSGPWLNHGLQQAVDRNNVVVSPDPQPGISEAMFSPVYAGGKMVGVVVLARSQEGREFRASDMCLMHALAAYCGDLIRNLRLVRELKLTSIAMVRSLVNAVEQKDEYTSGHSLRVGYYAALLGREMQLAEEELQMLLWSALLHDVGKIGIRDDVLKKPGKLTDDEFNHIKEHPVRSFKVVQEVPQLAAALDGVLHHHERWDGKGYPDGLSGEAIPKQARIIQIADVFDALTSSRSYRPAFDWVKALEIMQKDAGTAIDPTLQKVFDGLIRRIVSQSEDAWEKLVERATQLAIPTDGDLAIED